MQTQRTGTRADLNELEELRQRERVGPVLTRTRECTHTHKCAHDCKRTREHTHARTHTHSTRARSKTHTHARAHIDTQYTHPHARSRARTHARCMRTATHLVEQLEEEGLLLLVRLPSQAKHAHHRRNAFATEARTRTSPSGSSSSSAQLSFARLGGFRAGFMCTERALGRMN
jgi:hypothetical protein